MQTEFLEFLGRYLEAMTSTDDIRAWEAIAAAQPEHAVAVRRRDARRSFLGLEVTLPGMPAEQLEALVKEAWAAQAPKRLVNEHLG